LEGLEHPGIIRVRDCGFAGAGQKGPYVVMDYFDGATLEEHVKQNGPLGLGNTLEVARQMADGLREAHAQGVLHRDVKPSNVLVRHLGGAGGWRVKLIDFGLAVRRQALADTLAHAEALARSLWGSGLAGTLDYAAPEQLGKLPGVEAGPPADVYGF